MEEKLDQRRTPNNRWTERAEYAHATGSANIGVIEPRSPKVASYTDPCTAQDIVGTPPTIMRNITITQLNRGYVVGAGCHTFAFSTKEEVLKSITEYINEPGATEEKWFQGKLFN